MCIRDRFSSVRHPYTEALLRSIPKTSQRNHTRLAAIAGRPPDLINTPKGCKFAPRCPYAQPKCHAEEPPLERAGTGHSFRCWFPVGSDANKAAWEANLAAGLPQTLSVATGSVVDESLIDDVAIDLSVVPQVAGTDGPLVSSEADED